LQDGKQQLEEELRRCDAEIRRSPDAAFSWNKKARVLRALRRFDEALESCGRAIALAPENATFHVSRGNVLMELGRFDQAFMSYERATTIQPDLVEAHFNFGNAAAQSGRTEQSLKAYDRTIALRPGFAEAYHYKANALDKFERTHEALENYDRALVLKPDFAEAHNNRAKVLHRLGRIADSVESYKRAVACRPGYVLAWSNLAGVLKDSGRLEEALESCDRALSLAPDFAAAHYARGNILKGLKRLPEAIREFDRATNLQPGFEKAHWNKAVSTLLIGDFERGWRLYDRRAVAAAFPPVCGSLWTGSENLEGKKLLVQAEQGFGDTIQFCRFALVAAELGAKVLLAVQDPLVGLLKCLEPAIQVIPFGETLPATDYHIRLLSTPFVLRTCLDTIPSKVPYLTADPSRVAHWKQRIGTEGFRIGISWQGATGGEVDIGRSFPLRYFEGLSHIPGVRLFSLQKNAGSEQLHNLPHGMNVETFGGELDRGQDAFVDTAAAMESLDLVITPDTAIAHLGGALGRPVWVALSYVPDWRWMLDRDDSPWYPTMKLFRQMERNGWPAVFETMKAELQTSLLGNRP
jgi:tetratricopeptide (TPR) repeat protein